MRRQKFHQEQIELYGDRYIQYRQQYEAAGKFEYVPDFPLHIVLEQTYRCNLRCPMCLQALPEREAYDPGVIEMPWELFEQIVLEAEKYNCPSISMHGIDESLLVKDLPNRISFAKAHGFMDIIMSTNGMLLTQEKLEQLVEAGVTHLLISLDAVHRDTYEKVRVGGNYDKARKAVEIVDRFRRSRQSAIPIFRVSFVQNRLNQSETQEFVETFSSLVDYVEVQGFQLYHSEQLIPNGVEKVEDFRCTEPWRKLLVRANGDVLPCCSFYGYDVTLGNFKNTSLFELFNSPRTSQMRQNFKQGAYVDEACRNCSQSFYKPQAS